VYAPSSTVVIVTDVTITPGYHSGVHFKVRHLALTSVRGRFNAFDAFLDVGDDLPATRFGATIDLSTIDTNQPDRDAHLRGTDFFGVDAHPTLDFASTAIVDRGNGEYQATGDLTLHGVTRPVVLDVEFTGSAVNPADGKERAGFVATTQILRDDFGIDFNMPIGIDKLALGKKIDVEIDVQFVEAA
jgi:polyisoprenoid-binding protein YceI